MIICDCHYDDGDYDWRGDDNAVGDELRMMHGAK